MDFRQLPIFLFAPALLTFWLVAAGPGAASAVIPAAQDRTLQSQVQRQRLSRD